jgi:ubiquinone/menaquinone biosynthesis C-methylase UbiE
MKSYRKSHLDKNKAYSYHQQFLKNRYRAMIWSKEKKILYEILKKKIKKNNNTYLDFACGTGRILVFLSKYFKRSTGIDISKNMLQITKQSVPNSVCLKYGDITKNDILGENCYDLITVFRFFSNAEISLRKETMKVLVRHLKKDGIIIFNNHKNHSSILYTLARVFRRKNSMYTMKHSEVKSLCEDFGLKIVKTYSIGIFPSFDNLILLPIFLLSPLETVLSKIKFLKFLAFNIIYVCKLKE